MVFANFLIFLLISISWSLINLLRIKARFTSSSVVRISYICVLLTFIYHIWLYLIISNGSGDIKKNPGPKPNFYQRFSICHCHWRRSSVFSVNFDISVHSFLKFSILSTYIAVHNFDVICLSETHLNSSILHDDDSNWTRTHNHLVHK